jgi:hypothetical protein
VKRRSGEAEKGKREIKYVNSPPGGVRDGFSI